ncbi:hypothetical protein SteCoe_18430 [Stentor coeruleus]|uniref:Uncharacterized protein n=1 Tax=Stentor coeruleus TaxID=5963 RepID=A0A1R2BWG3_9CILI|nr:hypothetical protein SteCoe_18430 [Stentor coeruleus]
MAAIREKSPSEINIEKKLLNCVPQNVQNIGPLFDFYKNKAKEMINYHLDKPKKPRRYIEEDGEEYENIPIIKSSYKKNAKPKTQKDTIDFEPSDDYKRLRDLVNKRAYVIENVITVISNQKKSLNTIKITTNREHLLKQVGEVEEANEEVVSELEALLLTLHDALRQIDKLAQVSSFEKANLTKDLNVEFQESINKERRKYDAQIKALQDLNKSLNALPKATDVEKEYMKKLADLQAKVDFSQSSFDEKTEAFKRKNLECSELLQQVLMKNQDIDFLEKEQKNLQELIRSQEEGFERESSMLKAEISKLERSVKEVSSVHEIALKNEINVGSQNIQAKEREISKLKMDITNLEEQLRRQNFDIDSRQRTIVELREEIQHWQEDKKNASKNESQEIAYLRQAIDEKERQLIAERERISIEIETREKHRIKQKNEWAEIYTGLKHEIKEYKQTILDLTEDRERRGLQSCMRENELAENQINIRSQNESMKQKMKERDNEIKSLWEIISELQRTDMTKGRIDFNDVKTLIIIKNLEEKAKQRLKKFLS